VAPMATCNAQPRTTHQVSDVRTPGPWERPVAALSCLAHGPTCGPLRSARRAVPPTPNGRATMASSTTTLHGSPGAGVLPSLSRALVSRMPRDREQLPGKSVTVVHSSVLPHGHAVQVARAGAEQGYAVVCTDRQPAAAARPAAAWAPGCRPQLAALFYAPPPPPVECASGSRQVNFAGLRTGKNTATAMAHATRTTRLRMAHDGSMRFLERAEAFSLFFFFFFSAESASARQRSASCRMACAL
jgi:hypothetical protein